MAVEKFYPKIVELRAEVEYVGHQTKGDIYRCEVNLSIPGKLIRVEKTTPDFQKSVNKVKDHLKVVLTKERGKKLQKRQGKSDLI
jgi:ribosome-associated translation inhibitor RaiA